VRSHSRVHTAFSSASTSLNVRTSAVLTAPKKRKPVLGLLAKRGVEPGPGRQVLEDGPELDLFVAAFVRVDALLQPPW
jgi:hypothetical protein